MTDKPENPRAFPRTGEGFGNPHYDEAGMTLRDYFAGQAIDAIVAIGLESLRRGELTEYTDETKLAEAAYVMADAMLAERKKTR